MRVNALLYNIHFLDFDTINALTYLLTYLLNEERVNENCAI